MEVTTESQFKTLKIIYGALIMGVLMFLIYILTDIDNLHFEIDYENKLTYIIPALTIAGLVGNTFLFNNSLKTIKPEDNLQTKLVKYQTANIVRAAMLEGPALFGVMETFNTKNYFFLLFSGLLILVMLFYFPNKEKFKNLVELSFEEKSKLNTL